jgi:hypothetical protein
VQGIIETGRRVQSALDDLPHGDKATLWERLPFKKSAGHALIAIAEKAPRFSDMLEKLPPAWGTLYELTKLDIE